ncbi:MAG: hypothetical protein GKR88_00910 [Flavobacteriaceae bacterium]|nr:MAG: hypothetical protein GKR88_00910 [Flavobacteriaceae bacterium]
MKKLFIPLVLVCLIAISYAFTNFSNNKPKEVKTWYGCCTNHYKHKNLNYNCIRTTRSFKTYKKCRAAKKRHEKSYKKHRYACR